MAFDELVNEGEGGSHSSSERGVSGRDFQRIHPDQSVRKSVQTLHLFTECVGVSAIPTVRENDDDCSTSHSSLSPIAVEAAQALAETCSTAPVGHCDCSTTNRLVNISTREFARDSRKAGTEGEHLNSLPTCNGCMGKPDERSRIWFHRATDIKQENEAAWAC
jgi:hypothetical protein